MRRTSGRRLVAPGLAVLALGLTLSACGAANEQAPQDARLAGKSGHTLSGTVNGAGSSAQEAAQEAWRAGFQQANPAVTVNYSPVGSGAGVEQFLAGGTDFAGSDAALDPAQGQVTKASHRCGGGVIEVPDYVSPIAVVYHVPGVSDLRLAPQTLANIFSGKITAWDDPAIKQTNPGTKLPSLKITPVHRSDSSGTTENFTDYLHKASKGVWSPDASEDWPVKTGEGASGTSGVIAAVKAGKGTIGYADNSQAGDLTTVKIKVGGSWVGPSAESAAKALGASPVDKSRSETDLVVDIDRATTAPGAYPLMLTSYLVACPTYPAAKADLVKGYLSYVVSEAGQQAAAQNAGSAPLPAELQQKAAELIGGIKAKG